MEIQAVKDVSEQVWLVNGTTFVPKNDTKNTDAVAVRAWIEAGGTVEEAG